MVKTLRKLATCMVIPIIAATVVVTSGAEAKTKRTANVVVQNRTGQDIVALNLVHKYSDVYKSNKSWDVLKSGADSSTMTVTFNTGFGTTGQDWWAVNWVHPSENPKLYYSDPKNFRNIIDTIETASTVAIPIAAAAGVGAAGVLCTAKTVGACGPVAVAATKAAGAAAGVFSTVLFNSEGTSGFKKHFLEKEDEGKTVFIQLKKNNEITIFSKSGTSDTVYSSKKIDLSTEQIALIEANLGGGMPDFGSAWNSDFGKIDFARNTYGDDANKTLTGGLQLANGSWTYVGKWGRKNGAQAGAVIFNFSKDGKSFTGTYVATDGSTKTWNGKQ